MLHSRFKELSNPAQLTCYQQQQLWDDGVRVKVRVELKLRVKLTPPPLPFPSERGNVKDGERTRLRGTRAHARDSQPNEWCRFSVFNSIKHRVRVADSRLCSEYVHLNTRGSGYIYSLNCSMQKKIPFRSFAGYFRYGTKPA